MRGVRGQLVGALLAIVRILGFHSVQTGELLEILIGEIPLSDLDLCCAPGFCRCGEQGLLSNCSAWASHFGGFSQWQSAGSRCAGFSS